jgi:hypothetical protein
MENGPSAVTVPQAALPRHNIKYNWKGVCSLEYTEIPLCALQTSTPAVKSRPVLVFAAASSNNGTLVVWVADMERPKICSSLTLQREENPNYIHEVPLPVVKIGVWCAISAPTE